MEHAVRNGRPVDAFAPDAIGYLESRAWPGNVRQLGNVVERAVALARGGTITREELLALDGEPVPTAAMQPYPYHDVSLEDMKLLHMRRVLEHCGGNRRRAAEILGVSRSTLWAKLKEEGEA